MKATIYLIISLFIIVNISYAQIYIEDFTGGVVPAGVAGGNSYLTSINTQADGNKELQVLVRKADLWSGLYFSLPTPLNLSNIKDRIVSFDIRTDTTTRPVPYVAWVQIFSNTGTSKFTGAYERIIHPTGNYRRVTFNFISPNLADGVDFSAITGFQIVFAPKAAMSATVFVDNVIVGSGTAARPYFKGIPNQSAIINAPMQKVRISNATDATTQRSNVTFSAVSSNTSLIPTPTFTNNPILSNDYASFTSSFGITGNLISNNPVFLNYTPVANQFGTATITVTAVSTTTVPGLTLGSSRSIFTITVAKNAAPVIGQYPTALSVGSGATTTFSLSKISSGNPELDQVMTITGSSSDGTALPNGSITVTYPGGIGTDAKVSITPAAFGSLPVRNLNLTLTIKDNGGTVLGGADQSQIVIPVSVYPVYYNPPTINQISNQSATIVAGTQYLTLTGISDGNGGANVASVIATSSNTGVIPNPSINYTTGNRYAILAYNAATAGTAVISVTAINTGAPANSNGNSSYTTTFTVTGLNPPLTGYIETWTSTSVTGSTYYTDGGTSKSNYDNNVTSQKWYSEGQGTYLTTTINSGSGATVVVNKNGLGAPEWFAGLWYRPAPGATYDFRTYPYMSVTMSATSNVSVAADLFDINGNRYGLSSTVAVTGSSQTYTFCYNGIPSDANFDFSKVNRVLFNFPGSGAFANYNGTVSLSNLRIGDQAQGSGSCPSLNTTTVQIDTIGTRYYLTSENGAKTITLNGINAGISPAFGPNNNPVNLSINCSGSACPINVSAVTNGKAVLSYTVPNSAGVTNVTVLGAATGAFSSSKPFTIVVASVPAPVNPSINNNVNALMPDGQKGQTMDGFGATLNGNVGGSGGPEGYQAPDPTAIWGIRDQGMRMARMAIPPNFEYKNDNNDPNVINFEAFDYNSLRADQYLAYQAAGVEKFIGSIWSIPIWTKYNKSAEVPTNASYVVENTIDTSYVNEVAEFCTAYVLALKQKTGIELYALDFVNEPQFNEFYASAQITTDQYVLILNAVAAKFTQYGIKTLLFGPETLGQDNNVYIGAIANDATARNNLSAHARHNYADDGIGAGSVAWGPILVASRDSRLDGGFVRYQNNPLSPLGSVGNGGSGIPVWQTETSGQPWNWSGAFNYGSAIHSGITYGNVSAWTFWTFISGNRQDSYAQLTPSGAIPIYYAQKHYSKYILPGARRVPVTLSTSTGILMTAFQNPDASLVSVILNTNSSYSSINLSGTNMPSGFRVFQSYEGLYWNELNSVSGTGSINLPPKSMTTLWGGGNALIVATSVSVSGTAGMTNITTPGGSLQMNATVFPSNVPDKSVSWSVITASGGGLATIDAAGLLIGQKNGTVTVRATSTLTPTVFGSLVVTISGQYQPVLGMTISGASGINNISTMAGTLQMTASFNPTDASNKNITWSVSPSSGVASINSSGLITAVNNGIVTVTGISQDNLTVIGIRLITITGQPVAITSATISGAGGVNVITSVSGTLQMVANYSPGNATGTIVGWSVSPTTLATINNTSGLLTASNNGNGIVTVTGTFSTWGISSTRIVTISGQNILATGLTINGLGGVKVITNLGGNLQMTASLNPVNVTNTSVGWSLTPAVGIASINSSGLLTASNNGIVTVTGVTQDGSSISSFAIITITGQPIAITNATVNGIGGIVTITTTGGTLQMIATYAPNNATNTTLGWSLNPSSGIASINASGVLTASNNGVVTVTGTFTTWGVSAMKVITISGQPIPITSATVTGQGGSGVISTAGGSLQMLSTYAPANATNTVLGWTLSPTSIASLNSSGLLTANNNGNGVVTVTGNYTAWGISAIKAITISGQNVLINSMTLSGQGGVSNLTTTGGSLQMVVSYNPAIPTNTILGWSVSPTTRATINSSGVLTAIDNGTVTVTGTATDGSGVVSVLQINISNQPTSLMVSGTAGATTITVNGGALQMIGTYAPVSVTNTSVSWSVNGAAATISGAGLLQALSNGVVTVVGTSNTNSSIKGSLAITISNQTGPVVSVTGVTLTGGNSITSNGGSLVIGSSVSPSNATNKNISWSVTPGGIVNLLNNSGFATTITAINNGTVTIMGISQSNPMVSNILIVNVTGQPVPVVSATVLGSGGVNSISTSGGSLQMIASYSPSNATSTVVGWSITPSSGVASINSSGILTAVNNGLVTVTGNFSSWGISAARVVTISGQPVAVVSATVSGQGGVNNIASPGASLQMQAFYSPSNATSTTVGWTISATSLATINNTTGLLTASNNGNGIVTVTGNFSSWGVSASRLVTITGQTVLANGITVSGQGGSHTITTNGGSLQMNAILNPVGVTNTTVGWSVQPSSFANINSGGLLTAFANGIVTVSGATQDGTGLISRWTISISGQNVNVSSATVNGIGGITTISTLGGTLQMVATYAPANATSTTTGWSVNPSSGIASINSSGILTALNNGLVTVTATYLIGGVTASRVITISGQFTPVNALTVTGQGGAVSITSAGSTLQMIATVAPANATNPNVSWSVMPSSIASIGVNNGMLLSSNNGNGIVTVTATALDGSGVTARRVITITGQFVPVSSVSIVGSGGINTITLANGGLQMNAIINPVDATNKAVTWSLMDPANICSLNSSGFLQTNFSGNGFVTVVGTSVQNSSISAFEIITITGQTVSITGIGVAPVMSQPAINTDMGVIIVQPVYYPDNTTQKQYALSLLTEVGGGDAILDASGVLTAVDNGTVTIVGTSLIVPSLSGYLVVTITNQNVRRISVSGIGGINEITTSVPGTLQMQANYFPANGNGKTIVWSVISNVGQASIDPNSGVLTANSFGNGNVTVIGTVLNTTVSGKAVVSLSGQREPVKTITAAGANINVARGTYILEPIISPATATYKDVNYTILSGSTLANVSNDGTVSATDAGEGTIIVEIKSVSDPSVYTWVTLTISGQSTGMNLLFLDQDGVEEVSRTDVPQSSAFIAFANLVPNTIAPDLMRASMDYIATPEGIITITGGGQIFTGSNSGSVTITGTYINRPSISATMVINVAESSTTITGVNNSSESTLHVYPNPNNGKFYFSYEAAVNGGTLEIYNSLGMRIHSRVVSDSNKYVIDLEDQPKGIYNLIYKSSGGKISKAIIIQ